MVIHYLFISLRSVRNCEIFYFFFFVSFFLFISLFFTLAIHFYITGYPYDPVINKGCTKCQKIIRPMFHFDVCQQSDEFARTRTIFKLFSSNELYDQKKVKQFCSFIFLANTSLIWRIIFLKQIIIGNLCLFKLSTMFNFFFIWIYMLLWFIEVLNRMWRSHEFSWAS